MLLESLKRKRGLENEEEERERGRMRAEERFSRVVARLVCEAAGRH